MPDNRPIEERPDAEWPPACFGAKVSGLQAATIFARYKLLHTDDRPTWDAFAASVSPTIACDNAVAVRWAGMALLVEEDGYAHS